MPSDSKRKFALSLILLVVITLAAYLPATQGGFIWDDDLHVQDNLTLRSLGGLYRIWSQPGATHQYYPLVHTSFWLEYRFWQLNPAGYHVVNILLHAVCAVLLWRVLTILKVPAAWVAAAVFALHPVHVESVAWISERKNVLSGVFYLGAVWAYLRYASMEKSQPNGDRSGGLYTIAIVLFVCALLSKTVVCTLPAALLLVLWWKRQHINWSDIRPLLRFLVIGIALGLLTVYLERTTVGAVGQKWDLSFIDRYLIAGRNLYFYAEKLFWPRQLTFSYPRWQIDATVWQQYLFSSGAIAVIVVLWLLRHRIGRAPLVGVLFFAGTLLPALGFFNVYPFRYSFVADHFQYLASIGLITLAVGAGYLAVNRLSRQSKTVTTILTTVLLATLGTLTWQQCKIYQDMDTLWRDTLQKNPESWMAHLNLGFDLERRGKLDEAISHYRQGLLLEPNDGWAYNRLGFCLQSQGKFDEAISNYRRALVIFPDYDEARQNLASALRSQQKANKAKHRKRP